MSTAPTVTPSGVPLPLRFLDVVLVVAAAPLVLLTGVPVLGYVVGAVAWALQRVLGEVIGARARRSRDPRAVAGLPIVGVMLRAWLVGGGILAVGLLGAREDGLTAAVLLLLAFTVYFIMSVVLRPKRGSA